MAQAIYVKGTVRKDAVAILPKDCRVTEARVLETLYKEAYVPAEIRAGTVAEELTAQGELERLQAVYGHEAVENAYGKDGQARRAVAEVLALDTPAKVKASGLLMENDAVPLVVVDGDGNAPAAKPSGRKGKGGDAAASADSGGDSAQAAQ